MCVSYGIIEELTRISRIIFNIHFSFPPFPLPHIAYHRPEVVAGHGEHLFADALLHASLQGVRRVSKGRVLSKTFLMYRFVYYRKDIVYI